MILRLEVKAILNIADMKKLTLLLLLMALLRAHPIPAQRIQRQDPGTK